MVISADFLICFKIEPTGCADGLDRSMKEIETAIMTP